MGQVYNFLEKGNLRVLNSEEEKNQSLIKNLFSYCFKKKWLDEAKNLSLKLIDQEERDFHIKIVIEAYISLDCYDDAKELFQEMSEERKKEFSWLNQIN